MIFEIFFVEVYRHVECFNRPKVSKYFPDVSVTHLLFWNCIRKSNKPTDIHVADKVGTLFLESNF